MLTAWTLGGSRSPKTWQILIRFNKTREMLLSVTRVLSILLTTSVERAISKERIPKVPGSIPAAS